MSNAGLDKSFWAEAIVFTCHLINRLSLTGIGGKTLLDIWSGGAVQNYNLLWVFESPVYFSAKDGKINSQAKKFVFLYERLQVMGPQK